MAATSYNEFPNLLPKMTGGVGPVIGGTFSDQIRGNHQNSSSGLPLNASGPDSTSLATSIVNRAQKQRAKKYAKPDTTSGHINITNNRKQSAR